MVRSESNVNAPEVRKNVLKEKLFDLKTKEWAGRQVQKSWGKSKLGVFKEKRKMTTYVATVQRATELKDSVR